MPLPLLLLPALIGVTLGTAEALLQGDALRGTALRVLRTQRGLSGAEVARRSELSRPYLVQIERGERRAPKHTWTKILEALEATPEDLEDVVAAITNEQAKLARAKTEAQARIARDMGEAQARIARDMGEAKAKIVRDMNESRAKTRKARKALPAQSVPGRAATSQPTTPASFASIPLPEGQGAASATSATEGSELLEGLLRRAARLEPAELRLLLAYCEALEAGAAARPDQPGRKCSVCGYQGHDKRYCPHK